MNFPYILFCRGGRLRFGVAMVQPGRGAIESVTSTAAEVIRGNGAPGCAFEYLTRGGASELGSSGVRVNSVRLGFAEGSAAVVMPPGYADAIRPRSLLGSMGTPADFAAGVMWLCSAEAVHITGTVLDADGGGHINRRDGASTRARR